jgi:light-regulated signal transduction histidine kinase (bacteriophytochrome)
VAMDPNWNFVDLEFNPCAFEDYPVNRVLKTKTSFKNQVYGICQSAKKEIVWVLVNGIPVLNRENKIIEVIISFIDISDRIRAEHALNQFNIELEHSVLVRTQELENTYQQLLLQNKESERLSTELKKANIKLAKQNADKVKRASALEAANQKLAFQNAENEKRMAELVYANNELETFSYSVAHDLRAPLRHMEGFVNLLLTKFYDSLPDKAQHYLAVIAESSRQMGLLIDELLQFSRTGRQEMVKEWLNMNEIVQAVVLNIQSDNPGRCINWQLALLPHVVGDRGLLFLVWMNLLNNAVKFTQSVSLPHIQINAYEENCEYVFSVRDNGVGFDMQYADKLFGVFQRMHPIGVFEGTGIGLANVRRIILKHGGRTWAEAEVDKGAVFYFSLPMLKEV